ncbi:MAG: addiction module protein [Nitrospiraceae bacterium]
MSFHLPLKYMTLQEKLDAMESLWEDLARDPEAIESPAWHKEVLDERLRNLEQGKSQFVDWETAKGALRKKLS